MMTICTVCPNWTFISTPKMRSFTAKAISQFISNNRLVLKAEHIPTPSFFSNRYTVSNKHHVSGIWRSTTRLSILGFYPANLIPAISPPANGISSWRFTLTIFSSWVPERNATNSRFQLGRQFNIVNNGHVSSFLGINIERMNGIISLNQIGHIDRMTKRFQTVSSISTLTPLDHSLPLVKASFDSMRADDTLYKELTGSLNHLAIFTRPDTSLAVSKLSQCNQDPTITHLNATRRILNYAQSTKHFSIKFGGRRSLRIDGYADADWGSNLVDRKSTSGYIFMMNGGPISCTSRKQTSVALSTRIHGPIRCSTRITYAHHFLHLYFHRITASYSLHRQSSCRINCEARTWVSTIQTYGRSLSLRPRSKPGHSISNTFQAINKLPTFSQSPFKELNIKQLRKLYDLIRSCANTTCLSAPSKSNEPNDLKHAVFHLQFEQIGVFINQEFFALSTSLQQCGVPANISDQLNHHAVLPPTVFNHEFFRHAPELTKVLRRS